MLNPIRPIYRDDTHPTKNLLYLKLAPNRSNCVAFGASFWYNKNACSVMPRCLRATIYRTIQ